MAAPLVAAALKLAAQKIGKQAASAAISKMSGGRGGGGMDRQTKMILVGILIFAIIITGSIVKGVATLGSAFMPDKEMACGVPKVGDQGDSDPSNVSGGGTADGSYGSNIPYPTEDSSTVVYPVPNPRITSGYGYRAVPAGTRDFWGTGTYFHNGLDFAQPMGSPIYAAADGIVAQSSPNNNALGYGTVVTIHHLINGQKMNTTYGHVLPNSLKFNVGDIVKAGDIIAGVGSEGNSTGAHLHFVVTQGIYTILSEYNKDPSNNIDPVAWFASNGAVQTTGTIGAIGSGGEAGNAATTAELCEKKDVSDGTITSWGGHSNGAIPNDALQALSFNSSFRVEKEAAQKLEALNAAYRNKFTTNLPIVSAYKDLAAQGGTGTDIAGWAKSIELDKSVIFSSDEYIWLKSNATSHGWMNPNINQQNGSNPLSTRWVYVGDQDVNGGDLPANLGEYQKYAGERLQSIGMGSPSELSCLIKLWERESNWRVDADNPSSSAYGIPQALPGSKMSSAGADWATNPKTQINWGVGYIQDRYGTPCTAWQHSEDFNWY